MKTEFYCLFLVPLTKPYIILMKQLSFAVIGGGVSGLTFAVKASRIPYFNIKVFQKQDHFGGRTLSRQIEKGTFADLGANIIDFQSKEQESSIRSFLKDLTKEGPYQEKLLPLKEPFLIYQNQLKLGDYYKDRYCYKQGFKGLINDLLLQLKPEQLQLHYQVDSLNYQNGLWKLIDKNKKQYVQNFDYLVLATSGPHGLEIIKRSESNMKADLSSLKQNIQLIEYTTQISAAFQLKQAPSFSCILFKNKHVTFMSSHKEKYQSNAKSVVVLQFSHQFSLQNTNKEGKELVQSLIKLVPSQMKDWLGQCLEIKKWSPSLIKIKQKGDFMKFQFLQNKLLVVGDLCNGSSRVTGAMETAIEVFNLLKEVNPSKI